MSHFTVTVILPASADPSDGENYDAFEKCLNAVLARYDENREVEPYIEDGRQTTCNPDSKWDWWVIGGRWRGAYLPKLDADRSRFICGRSGTFDNPAKTYVDADGNTRNRVDGGPVGLLDLAGMRAEAHKKAEEDWNQYAAVVQGTPEPLPWSHFVERVHGAEGAMPKSLVHTIYDAENEINRRYGMPETMPYDEIPPEQAHGPNGETPDEGPYWTERNEASVRLKAEDATRWDAWKAEIKAADQQAREAWNAALSYSMDQARADYAAQPRVKATKEAPCYSFDAGWFLSDPVDIFDKVTRDEYAQRQVEKAVPGYATITLDGEWLAPGRMGWFGVSSDDDTSYEMYARQVNKMIDGLAPDTILVQLDCHI